MISTFPEIVQLLYCHSSFTCTHTLIRPQVLCMNPLNRYSWEENTVSLSRPFLMWAIQSVLMYHAFSSLHFPIYGRWAYIKCIYLPQHHRSLKKVLQNVRYVGLYVCHRNKNWTSCELIIEPNFNCLWFGNWEQLPANRRKQDAPNKQQQLQQPNG